MSDHTAAALRKIGEIEICGERLDVARNGQFCLVRSAGEDAYGRPVAEVVDLYAWLGKDFTAPAAAERVQGLIDLLGQSLVDLQAARDMRRRAGGEEP